jgi:hypothetical protein
MSIPEFEVMRAATDRRNTVWAAALATHVRNPAHDARDSVKEAILSLVERGDVVLTHSNWTSDRPTPLDHEYAEAALADESQWHPRRLPWARRLRLVATKQGADRFWSGEFGTPAPISISIPVASEALQLQALTCSEMTGMLVGVLGFLAGSTAAFSAATGVLPIDANAWSIGPVLAWVTGGVIGLTAALWAWKSKNPSADVDALPSDVIPDQFNQGPDLNNGDAFGDPRF